VNLNNLINQYLSLNNHDETNHSVINTNSFERSKFNRIVEHSSRLQKLKEDDNFPFFEPLLNDIWASFYKHKPLLKSKDDIPDTLNTNHEFIERILNNDIHKKYHSSTQGDETLSIFGTLEMGEQVINWFNEQLDTNKPLNDKIEKLKDTLSNHHENKDYEADEAMIEADNTKSPNQQKETLNELFNDIHQEMLSSLDENGYELDQSLDKAMNEAKNMNDQLTDLLGHSRTGESELTNVPLDDRVQLAETLVNNPNMKRIAEWAGKFKRIARNKRKSNSLEGNIRGKVKTGNNLSKILPVERIKYEINKEDFVDRFNKKQLIQYGNKGKNIMGKGSIIFVIDQSGSMEFLDEQSKGFALALMSIAKKQKRNFIYIPFSHYLGKVQYFTKGQIKPTQMFKLACEFMYGGTNFTLPLEETLKVIQKDNYDDADVIFVTDGEDYMSNDFINTFNKMKAELKFSLLSIVIGKVSSTKHVDDFSDWVIKVTSFDDEKAFNAFII